MTTPRRHHVRFKAEKKVSEPVEVKFARKDGTRVDFPAHEKVKRTVNVDFMARSTKK